MHLVPEPNNYGKVKVLPFGIPKRIKIPNTLKEFYRNRFYESRKKQFSLSNVVESKLQELETKGFIYLAKGKKVKVELPPKFPGKPLSKYLEEIRE